MPQAFAVMPTFPQLVWSALRPRYAGTSRGRRGYLSPVGGYPSLL